MSVAAAMSTVTEYVNVYVLLKALLNNQRKPMNRTGTYIDGKYVSQGCVNCSFWSEHKRQGTCSQKVKTSDGILVNQVTPERYVCSLHEDDDIKNMQQKYGIQDERVPRKYTKGNDVNVETKQLPYVGADKSKTIQTINSLYPNLDSDLLLLIESTYANIADELTTVLQYVTSNAMTAKKLLVILAKLNGLSDLSQSIKDYKGPTNV